MSNNYKSYNNNSKTQPPQHNNNYNKSSEPFKKDIINNIRYYDEKGGVDVNLFSIKAEEIVNEIAKLGKTCTGKDKDNKITQLRRFYNDILTIKNKIEYSKDVDALYIKIRDAKIVDSMDVEKGVTIDIDEKGHIVGIEILDASEKLNPSELANISIENIPLRPFKISCQSGII